MNQDRKILLVHKALELLGMIIGALPQAFVTTPWGHFIAALPGIATYAGALWLAWQYNGPLPSSPPSLNAPQPKT